MSEQSMQALARANEVRFARARLRGELARGEITLSDALADDRAQGLPIARLLIAQKRWGVLRVAMLLDRLAIRETRLVRDLTPRQADALRGEELRRAA